MKVVMCSFGIGSIAIGTFGLLDYFGVLEYCFAFPLVVLGLAFMLLSAREYRKVGKS